MLKVLRRMLNQRFGVPFHHFDPDLAELDLAALTRLSQATFEAELALLKGEAQTKPR